MIGFDLEPGARAGDLCHFSISGVAWYFCSGFLFPRVWIQFYWIVSDFRAERLIQLTGGAILCWRLTVLPSLPPPFLRESAGSDFLIILSVAFLFSFLFFSFLSIFLSFFLSFCLVFFLSFFGSGCSRYSSTRQASQKSINQHLFLNKIIWWKIPKNLEASRRVPRNLQRIIEETSEYLRISPKNWVKQSPKSFNYLQEFPQNLQES